MQRWTRPLDVEPGHWKKQLPVKVLDLAAKGNLTGLKALLHEHPEWLNKRGPFNRTMIWEAVRHGRGPAVELLVDLGADVDLTGCYNSETMVQITPYCAARFYHRDEIASYLSARAAKPDIFRAAFLGDRESVREYLDRQPEWLHSEDPEDSTYYVPLLSFAVAGGQREMVEFVIARGAQITPYSTQLLQLAARNSRRDLVELLLGHGADATAIDAGIFAVASDVELLRYLLGRGASAATPGIGGLAPLIYVARGDKGEHPEKVRLLLDHGAQIDVTAGDGRTALHYAAAAGHVKSAALLLDRGANTAARDRDGNTPLAIARARRKIDITRLLIARGATE